MKEPTRCAWVDLANPRYVAYHDHEWGVPQHDDTPLFELLILEGAQAGLSWSTILNKREGYRRAFEGFDPRRMAGYGERDKERLLNDSGIVRNRLKIDAAIGNARAYLALCDEGRSLDDFVWSFVGGTPIVNHWDSVAQIPATAPEAEAMSKALKKKGFRFVGPTICYAFMQAAGLVHDHTRDCFRFTG